VSQLSSQILREAIELCLMPRLYLSCAGEAEAKELALRGGDDGGLNWLMARTLHSLNPPEAIELPKLPSGMFSRIIKDMLLCVCISY
jgi:hypothetical protein